MGWWEKVVEVLKMPAYIEHRTIITKTELSKDDIFQLVEEGRVRIKKDGLVEITDKKYIDTKAKVLEGKNDN